MYRAMTVVSGCYHRDHSVSYVSRKRKPRLDICIDTLRLEENCLDALHPYDTCCISKENAVTLLVHEADAVARVVWTINALTLCIQKEYCPDTPRPEDRRCGTHRPEYKCLDTLRPEGKMP